MYKKKKTLNKNKSVFHAYIGSLDNFAYIVIFFAEAPVEPMRYSVATRCNPDLENCLCMTCQMVQIFSLKLAHTSINSGPTQLYGYIAARDHVDSMLNYVFNRSRDDPIAVHQVYTSILICNHFGLRSEF